MKSYGDVVELVETENFLEKLGVNSVTDCTRRGGWKTGKMEGRWWESGGWRIALLDDAQKFLRNQKKGRFF